MATKDKEGRVQDDMEMTPVLNVKDRVKNLEETHPDPTNKKPHRDKCYCFKKALASRFSGLFLGPLFGLFLYWYITYLILSGPPFTREIIMNANLTETVATDGGTSSEPIVLFDDSVSHIIGGSVGGTVGVLLVVGGLTSRRTRCAMLLMIPSLVSKRGRAFMISAAAGFLLSGPLETIDVNIQEVVRSITCLYESMKAVGQQYVDEFQRLWNDLEQIFTQINTLIKVYKDELQRLAASATQEAREEIEKSKRAVEAQAKALKEKLDDLKKVIEAPGNIAGGICGAGKSAVAWTEQAGKDIWGGLKSVFGKRRKKRNACGIKPIIPKFDINAPDVNLDALKDFLKTLDPDINLVDFDLDQIFSQLKANSISDIRLRLQEILKAVFDAVRTYAKYASKLFYLSIILIIWDAFYYMHCYYADDAFDNMFADDSLRELWRSGNKEKILPLRHWELQLKYQYSTAIKLSKQEAKRILIQSIPTIVFSLIAASILGFDAALTSILQVFRDNAKFGIAYDGMETGVNFDTLLPGLKSGQVSPTKLNLRGFNLTTEPCLPNPEKTDYGQTGFIGALIVLCMLSCILDAFGSRLRARICNLVFEDRALQRAEYLYKRIKAGRVARRFQFNMLLCQQLDILDRKAQFCFCCPCCNKGSSVYKSCSRVKISETCPGCKKSFKKDDGNVYKVTHNGEKKDVLICSECHEDVK